MGKPGAEAHHPDLVIFREEQRFTQGWLWILLLGGLALALGASLHTLAAISRRHCAVPPSFWLSLAFPSAFMLAIVTLFALTRMVTEVRADGMSVAFRPLQFRPKLISYADIAEYRAVTYRPIIEYGGWGIKRGGSGYAYNVSGNQGLLLTLKSGRTFLIGSQQPERLKAAVDAGAGNRRNS